MTFAVYTERFTMPAPGSPTITLQQLSIRIEGDDNLGLSERRELRSGIATFARVVGRDPSEITADPGAIRALASKASWQLAGLAKGTWANTMSRLSKAMAHVGIAVHRRRRNFKLSPEWDVRLAPLSRRDRDDIHRFAGWCTVNGVTPAETTIETFEAFYRHLDEETFQNRIPERWNTARRIWNRAIAGAPGSSYPTIPSREPPGWRALNWKMFPESLQAEIKIYEQRMITEEMFDENHRAIKPVTIKNYVNNLRWAATRAVEAGVPIDQLSSLSALVDVKLVKVMLERHKGERSLDEARQALSAMATAFLSVAKYLNVPEGARRELKRIADMVRFRASGMNAKNKLRLSRLDSDEAKQRLLTLPLDVARRLKDVSQPTVRQAQMMQMACLLEILIHLPLRIKNAADLDLEKHIQRQGVGSEETWRIAYVASEVKNARPIDAVLNPETTALLSRYVKVFRPRLLKEPTSAFFIGQNGGRKGERDLSRQFVQFIKRELGLDIHPHLMRHFAAFLHLTDNPGDYETVRQLLAHSQIETTIKFYAAGMEAKSAHARYDDVVAKRRAARLVSATAGKLHTADVDDLAAEDILQP